MTCSLGVRLFFFFNDTATTEIYTYGHTLSLHDALPIFGPTKNPFSWPCKVKPRPSITSSAPSSAHFAIQPSTLSLCACVKRSEEHTSELQSLMRISYAVFCLKKKTILCPITNHTS